MKRTKKTTASEPAASNKARLDRALAVLNEAAAKELGPADEATTPLVLEDGAHPDDAAEREATSRGQAASEAMAADDKDADAEAIQEEVDGVVLAGRDRNTSIAAMRREGKSLSAIGKEFGLSGTRVYRICALAGVVTPPKPKAPAKPKAKKAKK